MTDVNVLIVFYSRYGTAEQLALAVGVGAIQDHANIRLRRVADHAPQQTIDADPTWRRNLDQMNRDYVAPRPADPEWADVIVLVSPAISSIELEEYVASLRTLCTTTGKIAAPLAPGNSKAAVSRLSAAAAASGLVVAPLAEMYPADAVASARGYGRQICQMARVLKGS